MRWTYGSAKSSPEPARRQAPSGFGQSSSEGEMLSQLLVLRHLRVLNCIIAAVGVFVGFTVASGRLDFSLNLVLGMLSAFLITGAGNLINDFFDLEVDRRAFKETPLVSGEAHPGIAFGLSMLFFLAGILIAFAINENAFALACVVSGLLIAYSSIMRDHKYIGNVVVAAGTALTLVFGAAIVGNYLWAGIFAFSAFLTNIGRELTKDLEDMDSDSGLKRTLPMIIGFEWTKRVVFVSYAGAIMVAGTAWAGKIVNGFLFVALLLLAALIFFIAWERLLEKRFGESQKYSKYAMIVALLAFISVVL